jgi:hypothetical protein
MQYGTVEQHAVARDLFSDALCIAAISSLGSIV